MTPKQLIDACRGTSHPMPSGKKIAVVVERLLAQRDTLARIFAEICAGLGCAQDGEAALLEILTLHERIKELEAADEIDRLRKQTEWQPMDTAPMDGTLILARCEHEAAEWGEDDEKRLAPYAAHAEGMDHVEDGCHVLVWGGGYDEAGDEYGYGGYTMPDWWFRAGSDFEEVANPVAWMPIPGATEKDG